LDLKADSDWVTGTFTTKTYFDSQNTTQNTTISAKADKTYVDSQNTAQNTTIALKADSDWVTGTFSTKTYVDSQNTTQNTTISAKADKTYVDSQDTTLNNKFASYSLTSHTHTSFANLSLSGTLSVTGATTLTGNLTSNGTTALKNTGVTGTLAVSGATTLTGNLTSNGTTTLKTTNVTGNLTSTGTVVGTNVLATNETRLKASETNITAKADKTYVYSQNTTQNTTLSAKADNTYVDSQDTTLNNKFANYSLTSHTHTSLGNLDVTGLFYASKIATCAGGLWITNTATIAGNLAIEGGISFLSTEAKQVIFDIAHPIGSCVSVEAEVTAARINQIFGVNCGWTRLGGYLTYFSVWKRMA
jgi:hypothetical protein